MMLICSLQKILPLIIEYLRLVDQLYYIPAENYHYRVAWKPAQSTFITMSAIKNAHLIVSGMTELENQSNIYESVRGSIEKIAAEKFYYGRLPMVFTRKPKVPYRERKELFHLLCNPQSDTEYLKTCMAGAKYFPTHFLMRKASKINQFWSWSLFYWLYDTFMAREKSRIKLYK